MSYRRPREDIEEELYDYSRMREKIRILAAEIEAHVASGCACCHTEDYAARLRELIK